MKEPVKVTEDGCEFCGQSAALCDCCMGCVFPLSGHCANCDDCACNGC